jgi:tryptophan-rich sensory protein
MKNWLFPLWVIIDVLIWMASLAMWIAAPEHTTLNVGLTIFAITLGALLCMVKIQEIKLFVKSTYFKKK